MYWGFSPDLILVLCFCFLLGNKINRTYKTKRVILGEFTQPGKGRPRRCATQKHFFLNITYGCIAVAFNFVGVVAVSFPYFDLRGWFCRQNKPQLPSGAINSLINFPAHPYLRVCGLTAIPTGNISCLKNVDSHFSHGCVVQKSNFQLTTFVDQLRFRLGPYTAHQIAPFFIVRVHHDNALEVIN